MIITVRIHEYWATFSWVLYISGWNFFDFIDNWTWCSVPSRLSKLKCILQLNLTCGHTSIHHLASIVECAADENTWTKGKLTCALNLIFIAFYNCKNIQFSYYILYFYNSPYLWQRCQHTKQDVSCNYYLILFYFILFFVLFRLLSHTSMTISRTPCAGLFLVFPRSSSFHSLHCPL